MLNPDDRMSIFARWYERVNGFNKDYKIWIEKN